MFGHKNNENISLTNRYVAHEYKMSGVEATIKISNYRARQLGVNYTLKTIKIIWMSKPIPSMANHQFIKR